MGPTSRRDENLGPPGYLAADGSDSRGESPVNSGAYLPVDSTSSAQAHDHILQRAAHAVISERQGLPGTTKSRVRLGRGFVGGGSSSRIGSPGRGAGNRPGSVRPSPPSSVAASSARSGDGALARHWVRSGQRKGNGGTSARSVEEQQHDAGAQASGSALSHAEATKLVIEMQSRHGSEQQELAGDALSGRTLTCKQAGALLVCLDNRREAAAFAQTVLKGRLVDFPANAAGVLDPLPEDAVRREVEQVLSARDLVDRQHSVDTQGSGGQDAGLGPRARSGDALLEVLEESKLKQDRFAEGSQLGPVQDNGCRFHMCLLVLVVSLATVCFTGGLGGLLWPSQGSQPQPRPMPKPTRASQADEVSNTGLRRTEQPARAHDHDVSALGDGAARVSDDDEDTTDVDSDDGDSTADSHSLPNPAHDAGKGDEPTPALPAPLQMPLAEGDLCNATRPLPEPTRSRYWLLDPSWQEVCMNKWFSDEEHKDDYPGRNWCWIGYKTECHWNLKLHKSWSSFQVSAAARGATLPREVGPFDPILRPEMCDNPEAGAARSWTSSESARARQWFLKNVKVFVLNLKTDVERWTSISKRLKSMHIQVTRIDGLDMRSHHNLGLAKSEGWVPHAYNFTAAQEEAYSSKQEMGSILGTLGCASGHFKAQEAVIASGSPLAVVFEDDVYPEDDFVQRLWSLVTEELPCDWNIVSLYSRCPFGRCVSQHLTRVETDMNEPAWGCHHGVNWGMQGILYRAETLREVQKFWKQVVFDEKRPRCMDVDVALASIAEKVAYYAVPAVQDPGFLHEMDQGSARWNINEEASKKEEEEEEEGGDDR